jgi:hypothetical protein
MPQDIATSSSPQFASLYIGSASQPAINSSNIIVESQITCRGLSGTSSLLGLDVTQKNLTSVVPASGNLSIDPSTQELKMISNPTFTSITLGGGGTPLSRSTLSTYRTITLSATSGGPNGTKDSGIIYSVFGNTCSILFYDAPGIIGPAPFKITATLPNDVPRPVIETSFFIVVPNISIIFHTNGTITIYPLTPTQLFEANVGVSWPSPFFCTYTIS